MVFTGVFSPCWVLISYFCLVDLMRFPKIPLCFSLVFSLVSQFLVLPFWSGNAGGGYRGLGQQLGGEGKLVWSAGLTTLGLPCLLDLALPNHSCLSNPIRLPEVLLDSLPLSSRSSTWFLNLHSGQELASSLRRKEAYRLWVCLSIVFQDYGPSSPGCLTSCLILAAIRFHGFILLI